MVSLRLRSLVLLSVVIAAFGVAPSALAGTGGSTTTTTAAGTGGSTTATATGAGGAAATTGAGGSSTGDLSCNVAQEEIAGTTCQECGAGATVSCSNLGSAYSFVCQQAATVAVWCNGPARDTPSDQNASCAVGVPGHTWSGLAAAGALAAAIAMQLRRRRRS
jgi:hypothetical protein